MPLRPTPNAVYWIDSPNGHPDYTHRLFRFPAKFHPPIVRWALRRYGRDGITVLDPFNGSGTVQLEAMLSGYDSVGVDVDPLSCMIASVKTTPIDPELLIDCAEELVKSLDSVSMFHADRERVPGGDISVGRYREESAALTLPNMPNITYWFRRYVIIDIARILDAIESCSFDQQVRSFFRACVAAIIRRISNADPEPVSGLEVTKVQRVRNESRCIRVYDIFFDKVDSAISGMAQLWDALNGNGQRPVATVELQDVQSYSSSARKGIATSYGLVLTSPPYCTAVEYSRRHRLEMYWLGFVDDQNEHVELGHKYIGRKLVRMSDVLSSQSTGVTDLDKLIEKIEKIDRSKARAVLGYFTAMRTSFETIQGLSASDGRIVIVVGDSVCAGVPVPTSEYLQAIASDYFRNSTQFSYTIRNHSMQYGLWNGSGIKRENVMVFRKA